MPNLVVASEEMDQVLLHCKFPNYCMKIIGWRALYGSILFGSVGGKVSGIVFHFERAIHFLVFAPVSISAHPAIFLNFTIFFSFSSRSVFAFAASRLGSFGDTLPSWLRDPKLCSRSVSYFGREKCANGKTALRNICQRKRVSLEHKKVETMTGRKRAEKVFYQT